MWSFFRTTGDGLHILDRVDVAMASKALVLVVMLLVLTKVFDPALPRLRSPRFSLKLRKEE